jgi:hypothetical protein
MERNAITTRETRYHEGKEELESDIEGVRGIPS